MSEELIDRNLPGNKPQRDLDGTGGILAMGILSIVLCGLIGLILGIIAITKANSVLSLYNEYPGEYTESSRSQAVSGKICAIIGISLLGLILIIAVAVAAVG